jgi:glucose-6-phosphate 1-dehydrogenase
MDFSYAGLFGGEAPEAYQRLLLDCIAGDQTLFTRRDEAEAAWRLLMPVLEQWASGGSDLHEYPVGADNLPAAEALIAADARKWRPLRAFGQTKTRESE